MQYHWRSFSHFYLSLSRCASRGSEATKKEPKTIEEPRNVVQNDRSDSQRSVQARRFLTALKNPEGVN